MKSIIKSVEILNNVVTVTTKSNVVRIYTLKSNEIAQQYYNDIKNSNNVDNVFHLPNNMYNNMCSNTKMDIVNSIIEQSECE